MRTGCTGIAIAMIMALSTSAGLAGPAVDISGTWTFSVDVAGTQGDPTFNFKQQGDKLSGTVARSGNTQPITGSVKGNRAVFGFQGARGGQGFKAVYSGVVESATKMRGSVEFSGALSGRGEWTATRARK